VPENALASTHVLVRDPTRDRLWTAARSLALVAVVGLLAWLVVDPGHALTALWYVAVPVLPATFFVNPAFWRGVCPLATLNEWGNHVGTRRPLTPRVAALLATTGLILFHAMVPARRFLFNLNGPALAGTVAAVGALAVALGAIYPVRSAFCNALCPVLPVELLYGQAPLLPMTRGRCATCTLCTPRGCLDLAQGRAFNQVLGPGRRSAGWLLRPYGLFVAGLPGFVIGYASLADGPLATAPLVYATTLGWSLASLGVAALLVIAFRIEAGIARVVLAGSAGLLYYWFAGPTIARELGLGNGLALGIRVVGMGLVAFWLARTLRVRTGSSARKPLDTGS
jgi:hypothetical protein